MQVLKKLMANVFRTAYNTLISIKQTAARKETKKNKSTVKNLKHCTKVSQTCGTGNDKTETTEDSSCEVLLFSFHWRSILN